MFRELCRINHQLRDTMGKTVHASMLPCNCHKSSNLRISATTTADNDDNDDDLLAAELISICPHTLQGKITTVDDRWARGTMLSAHQDQHLSHYCHHSPARDFIDYLMLLFAIASRSDNDNRPVLLRPLT